MFYIMRNDVIASTTIGILLLIILSVVWLNGGFAFKNESSSSPPPPPQQPPPPPPQSCKLALFKSLGLTETSTHEDVKKTIRKKLVEFGPNANVSPERVTEYKHLIELLKVFKSVDGYNEYMTTGCYVNNDDKRVCDCSK